MCNNTTKTERYDHTAAFILTVLVYGSSFIQLPRIYEK